MKTLDVDEIDREIAMRAAEVAAMSANLVQLDDHPGLRHVRSYTPTGVTATQWVPVESSLAQLWHDLGLATTVVAEAQEVRARRSRPSETDRGTLTRLLRGRPIEDSGRAVPLAQRRITDPAERVDYVGLTDVVVRMQDAYPAVVGFLDAVDQVDALVAARLASLRARLDAAGLAGPPEIVELLTLAANDPLSLSAYTIEQRITVITDWVQRATAELTELTALQEDWGTALADTAARLEALHRETERAIAVRAHVEQRIVTGPPPAPTDTERVLRSALEALSGEPTAPAAAALLSLRARIEAARRGAVDDERLVQGLLDRRSELRGRLTVYQAKAARLGRGEESELVASGRIAAGLLARRPCDLRAVTRAVNDFQQLVVGGRGETS